MLACIDRIAHSPATAATSAADIMFHTQNMHSLTRLCASLYTVYYADCNGITATAVVKLVYSPNDPMALLAVNDKYSFSTSITIPTARGVLANDRNAASCTAALVPTVLTAAAKGTVSLSADGSFSYVPGSNPGEG
jgi:hypothetical protein